MPNKVDDDSAALIQFKTVFTKRYFQGENGPNFSTKVFGETVKEAFCGSAQTRKALGKIVFDVFYTSIINMSVYVIGLS